MKNSHLLTAVLIGFGTLTVSKLSHPLFQILAGLLLLAGLYVGVTSDLEKDKIKGIKNEYK